MTIVPLLLEVTTIVPIKKNVKLEMCHLLQQVFGHYEIVFDKAKIQITKSKVKQERLYIILYIEMYNSLSDLKFLLH